LREFLRFRNQFRGQIVAKSEVQLVTLARFIRAVDPLRIDPKEHVRVGMSELPRDVRRIGAGHERERRKRVPHLIRFAIT
jgi:hypothetical protein